MSKLILHKESFTLTPYPNLLTIAYSNKIHLAYDGEFKQFFGEMDGDGLDELTCAFVTHDDGGHVLVLFGPNVTHEIIAHESFHILHQIVSYTGMEFDHDIDASNEHLAYLMGHIVKLVYTFLSKHKIRVIND